VKLPIDAIMDAIGKLYIAGIAASALASMSSPRMKHEKLKLAH
jgi:hypothetical protein